MVRGVKVNSVGECVVGVFVVALHKLVQLGRQFSRVSSLINIRNKLIAQLRFGKITFARS